MDDIEGPQDGPAEDGAETGSPEDVRAFEGERPSIWGAGTLAAFPTRAHETTPLDEDEHDGAVPKAVLWAMKDHRHEQLPHPFGHPHRIRAAVGAGAAAVYVIDDGSRHCVIGRRVGATKDGAVYSLVARVPRSVYDDLTAGSLDGRGAFLASTEAALVGTGEEPGLANVFDVHRYREPSDVPAQYLPPSPEIDFADDLPTADG